MYAICCLFEKALFASFSIPWLGKHTSLLNYISVSSSLAAAVKSALHVYWTTYNVWCRYAAAELSELRCHLPISNGNVTFNECEWLLLCWLLFMLCLNNSLAMIYGIYDDNINTYLPICYILRLVSIGRYLVT